MWKILIERETDPHQRMTAAKWQPVRRERTGSSRDVSDGRRVIGPDFSLPASSTRRAKANPLNDRRTVVPVRRWPAKPVTADMQTQRVRHKRQKDPEKLRTR